MAAGLPLNGSVHYSSPCYLSDDAEGQCDRKAAGGCGAVEQAEFSARCAVCGSGYTEICRLGGNALQPNVILQGISNQDDYCEGCFVIRDTDCSVIFFNGSLQTGEAKAVF